MNNEVSRGTAISYVKVKLWAKLCITILQRIPNVLPVLDKDFAHQFQAALRLAMLWCHLRSILLQSAKVVVTSVAIGKDQEYFGVVQVSKKGHD